MAKSRSQKKVDPEKSFPAPITTPRGRRHVALLIILAGLLVSNVYHSSMFQYAVSVLDDKSPSSSQWSNLPTTAR